MEPFIDADATADAVTAALRGRCVPLLSYMAYDRRENLHPMTKNIIITLVGLLILIGLPIAIKMRQFNVMSTTSMVNPPETVTADRARKVFWPNTVTAVGSLVAVQGVTVGAELGGKIVKIAFESGDRVKTGDMLIEIDTSTEEAQLRSADAAATLARINLNRTRELLAKRTVSRAEFDSAEATYKQTIAEADNIRAIIGKKILRAPFAGRLGLRLVNLGQILKEGDPIVTLQTLDPIYADFSVPQQLFSILAVDTPVRVSTDAAPGEIFEGTINAVSPEIDSVTRNVRVQAIISNVGEKLRAGMFANIEVMLPDEQAVLAIPATAVLYAPYGDTVFIVEEKRNKQIGKIQNVLRQQIVRLGDTRGDFVSVLSGLKAGDQVVTSGVFKLRPGMPVVIDNTLAPNAQLSPTPPNK
jgi:membrane fusion protein (multidrug efflux system)